MCSPFPRSPERLVGAAGIGEGTVAVEAVGADTGVVEVVRTGIGGRGGGGRRPRVLRVLRMLIRVPCTSATVGRATGSSSIIRSTRSRTSAGALSVVTRSRWPCSAAIAAWG